ncbi:hypothetical protein VTN00DRAFT_6606 [Thermoascus crustaceus]|uniref:uncharacterized protein n=1 Tax=Thermoascus crustaceus TaxID=5088 RepID=UPI0037446446
MADQIFRDVPLPVRTRRYDGWRRRSLESASAASQVLSTKRIKDRGRSAAGQRGDGWRHASLQPTVQNLQHVHLPPAICRSRSTPRSTMDNGLKHETGTVDGAGVSLVPFLFACRSIWGHCAEDASLQILASCNGLHDQLSGCRSGSLPDGLDNRVIILVYGVPESLHEKRHNGRQTLPGFPSGAQLYPDFVSRSFLRTASAGLHLARWIQVAATGSAHHENGKPQSRPYCSAALFRPEFLVFLVSVPTIGIMSAPNLSVSKPQPTLVAWVLLIAG